MQEQKKMRTLLRSITCFIIILCCPLGLILMLLNKLEIGIALWVLSTLAGIGLLYIKRTNDKKEEDLRRMEEEERAYQASLKKE